MNFKKISIFLVSFITLVALLSWQAQGAITLAYFFNTSTNSNYTSSDILRTSTVALHLVTDKPSTCRYSSLAGLPYSALESSFDADFDTVHKKYFSNLAEGNYKYYIRCKDNLGIESGQLIFTFAVSPLASADITFSKTPPFNEGKVKVTLTTSRELSQTPSLSYSFDGISYNPLPLAGLGKEWFGYLFISPSVGEAVGSFRFSGKDMEGFSGEEIKSGKIFLVDTIPPSQVIYLDATGRDGSILLDFEYNYDYDKFKIYRSTSPGVDYTNYLDETEQTSFIDTNVERGKTYYYRIGVLDEAGNEATLSGEVYTSALLKNISQIETGLSLDLLGSLDSQIADIESLLSLIEETKPSLSINDNTLSNDLKLEREFQSAKQEVESLLREVNNYRSQNINKNELDKKLNAAQLKLNTIKKKIPSQIIVLEEENIQKNLREELINQVYLKVYSDVDSNIIIKNIENNLEELNNIKFKTNLLAYKISLVYLDGTTKDLTLVKEKIISGIIKNDNYTLVEYFPNSVSLTINDIEIKNSDYDLINDEIIFSFPSETKEIVYVIRKHLELNSLRDIETFLLLENLELFESNSLLTGYSILGNNFNKNYSIGIIISLLIIILSSAYLFFLRSNRIALEKINKIKENISLAKERISNNNLKSAREIYLEIAKEYKTLRKKDKELIYGYIQECYNLILEKNLGDKNEI